MNTMKKLIGIVIVNFFLVTSFSSIIASAGLEFSYYEFKQPLSNRLTGEQ